jgi:hypothetical protein
MNSYVLNIAGYKIRFESADDGPELVPSERFRKFLCKGHDTDFLIKIHSGKYDIPRKAEKVFNAPYVEEISGIRIKKSNKFWSIYKNHHDLFIKTSFPLSPKKKKAVLKFSLKTREWEMWIEAKGRDTDPMEYPADGLILYYISAIHGDIMIHASGINNAGKGYLFSGISGRGKTTMAKLWDKAGAYVIHDDRLIIRNTKDGFMMYNTPVYKNDSPRKSRLDRFFLIEHGKKNRIIPVKGAECVSLILSNCIQHNWNAEIIENLLSSISVMSVSVPVAMLFFKPDKSVIDHILENG